MEPYATNAADSGCVAERVTPCVGGLWTPKVIAAEWCDCEDRLESEPVRVDSTETSWLLSVGRECVGWSMETVDARLDTVCPSPTLLIDELRSAPESPLAIRELRADGLPYGERGCRGRCRPNVDQGEDVDA